MSKTIGIVSLNVLLDKTRSSYALGHPEYVEPQHKRVESLSNTLAGLPISPDIVMLQEVHVTGKHHCGDEIAENLGVGPGFWFNHNTSKRQNEYIGVCGKLVEDADKIDVGHDKVAVIVQIGDVACIGIHLRRTLDPRIKMAQMRTLLKETDHFEKRVIVGDANARPGSRTRKLLLDAGAQSVAMMKRGEHPSTWPTKNYRDIFLSPRQQRVVEGTLSSIDIFEVIGFDEDEILSFDTVNTLKSDHFTLFGELAVTGVISRAEQ